MIKTSQIGSVSRELETIEIYNAAVEIANKYGSSVKDLKAIFAELAEVADDLTQPVKVDFPESN